MAQLPLPEAITRFQANEERVDVFVNGSDTQNVTPSGGGTPYPTQAKAVAKLVNVGGMIGAADLTALQAITPTYANQVGLDESTGNLYRWNGTSWVNTGRNSYQDSVNYVNNNRMFKPFTITTATDFNTLKTYGLHVFVDGTVWNNSANKPTFTNQYGQVFVFPVSTDIVTQLVVAPNTNAFAMRLSLTATTWSAWKYFSDDSALTTAITKEVKAAIATYTRPIYASKSINLLDPSNLLDGYEIHSTNGVIPEANSVTTEYIDVRGQTAIAISGLQPNPQIARLYRFLDKDQNVVGTVTNIGSVNQKVLTVPANAQWFQISIKQRNPDALNIATAQIEYGSVYNPYVAFNRGDIVGLHGAHIKQTDLTLGYSALGKNMLNPSTLLMGVEVYNNGSLLSQAQSVTTDLINVSGLQNITLSGLQPNPEIPRYYRFLDADKNLVGSAAQVPNPNTVYTITIPTNAKYFQLSLLQRTATVLDTSNTQIENGTNATAHENYAPGVSSINGTDIVGGSAGSTPTIVSRAFGAKYLIFGDSITQTSDVDNGSVNSHTWSANWPTYAFDQLKMSDFKNYAKSGAAFREYGQTNPWQMISHQINTSITNNENPDVIIIACGTNDAGVNLGDFDTAMGKATLGDLNRALTLESMRWALWTLKQQWPNAVCFFCTPLQRADTETVERKALNENLPKMARQYGFNVIDQYGKSGIVKDLEVWQADGTFLIDGLHTNAAGKPIQSNCICSEIIKTMTY